MKGVAVLKPRAARLTARENLDKHPGDQTRPSYVLKTY